MPLSLDQMGLSGPIPGESLTQEPGSRPYEKPPKFTQLNDAMKFVINGFQNKDQVHQLLALLEAGAPMDTIVQTIIMHGFSEGMWTPSLGALLIQPLATLLTVIAKRAGVKHIPTYKHTNELAPLFDIIDKKKAKDQVSADMVKKFQLASKANASLDPQQSAGITSPSGNGFMSPPTPQ